MTEAKGQHELGLLAELLARLPEVRLAVLFGSLARGRSAARSDVDIGLLLGEPGTKLGQEIELMLARAVRRELDLVYLDDIPPLLRFQIAREGIVLLERTPHLWSNFRAQAMVDWWEWSEVAGRIQAAALSRLRRQVSEHGAR